MSKERELLIESLEWMQELKYVWADERDSGDRLLLIADINKVEQLLAQPEQSNEPVAWFYERQIEGFTERTMSVGFEENFDGVTIPLYLEPPRRETLREHIDNHKVWYQIGYEKAKQELEPLCRHSIVQAYMASNFDNYYDCFDDGIKFAEKAHGITGEMER